MRRWWTSKLRRTWRYIGARVGPDERETLEGLLSPSQLELFDRMHVADRRHGLDVLATLKENGVKDPDVLVAGVLHDAGKGRTTRLWHRVVWSLGEVYGGWIWRIAAPLPGFRAGLERMRRHAEVSAALASAAGCSDRTIALIRNQEHPVSRAGRLLAEADEAN